MSYFTIIRSESFCRGKEISHSSINRICTIAVVQLKTTKYTRSTVPETYQFWLKKGKQNTYSINLLSKNYQLFLNNLYYFEVVARLNNVELFVVNQLAVNSNKLQQDLEQYQEKKLKYLGQMKCSIYNHLLQNGRIRYKYKQQRKWIMKEFYELEDENDRLRLLIEQTLSEVINERITEINNQTLVWKRKFQEINHDYCETQEK